MSTGTHPQAGELERALGQTGQEVGGFFAGLPGAAFFDGDDERWSPAHHLAHLTVSNTPVASALGLPKDRLTVLPSGRPARSYTEIQELYRVALSQGVRASGRFLPHPQGTSAELVTAYLGSVNLLRQAIGSWADEDLDRLALPHPVLGLLSVREMLYFTLLHNRHHLDGVRARLERA